MEEEWTDTSSPILSEVSGMPPPPPPPPPPIQIKHPKLVIKGKEVKVDDKDNYLEVGGFF